MTFDTAFERSHTPNTMNAEKDKAPERVWLDLKDGSWFSRAVEDDEGAIADPDEVLYVRSDLLATARKEAREAAFREMIGSIAVLPMQGTMNYRRGYEEGVRDALRTLEAATTDTRR